MKISKKTAKIMNIIIIAIAILMLACNFSLADELKESITPNGSALSSSVANISGSILGIAQTIGIAVAIIMLIVLAIKYISAAPNDKADIKKHAVIYIVGAVILFAASGIVGLIRTWSSTTIR